MGGDAARFYQPRADSSTRLVKGSDLANALGKTADALGDDNVWLTLPSRVGDPKQLGRGGRDKAILPQAAKGLFHEGGDDPTRKRGYRLVGDVDYESVIEKVYAITPVPGGVGPMTITMLLNNTLKSWMKSNHLSGNVA